MNLKNAVALVTGANRGIGLAFTHALLARGARKVYAGVRDPASMPALEGCHPLRLDVTRIDQVAAAAAAAPDATLVINNAGIAEVGGFLSEGSEERTLRQLETNVFGVLRMTQAFAPILRANGGGAFVNVLSVASWINGGTLATYAATKSAAWSLTNSLRYELAGQPIQILALHMGFVDTDLTRGLDVAKSTPEAIVEAALDGLEAGADEVLADLRTRQVKEGLVAARPSYLPPLA